MRQVKVKSVTFFSSDFDDFLSYIVLLVFQFFFKKSDVLFIGSESLVEVGEVAKMMTEEKINLDLKSVDQLKTMHKDVIEALSWLPDFGFSSPKNQDDIAKASALLEDLGTLLEYFVYIGNYYQDTLSKLKELLKDAGVSQCVDDLVTVKRNARRIQSEPGESQASNF